jgi:hypothetical protein
MTFTVTSTVIPVSRLLKVPLTNTVHQYLYCIWTHLTVNQAGLKVRNKKKFQQNELPRKQSPFPSIREPGALKKTTSF